MNSLNTEIATSVEGNGRFSAKPIPPDAIREQLARILAASGFVNAGQLSRFLRFVVGETLNGRAEKIKQYTVAVGALGHKTDFDPQIDPIVRITAARLRKTLTRYYETEGVQDPIVITLPKGAYVPMFCSRNVMENDAPEQQTAPYKLTMPQGPTIVVLPFDCLLNKQGQYYLVDGLTEQLVVTFNRFPEYLIIGPLPRQNGATGYRDLRAVGQEYGAQFILSGSLRQQGERLRLTVKLTDMATGGAIWADTFDNEGNLGDLFAFEDMAVNRITAVLGGNFGVIPRTLTEEALAKATEDTAVYDAILRYYYYLAVYTEESRTAAFAALERAVRIAPDYPLTLAFLADLNYLDYHLFGADETVLRVVERLVLRAVTIDPQCQHARFVQACTYYQEGYQELFILKLEQAVALNPNNAFLLFAGSVYLTIIGEQARGATYLARAKRLNPHFPGWIHLPPFLVAYRRGDYVTALAEAKRFNTPAVYVDPLIRAATAGQLGRREEGERAVSELLALHPDFSEHGRGLMRRFFFSHANVQMLADGLAKAGLQLG